MQTIGRKQLQANPNSANGGVGVSYSNVVLQGGLNPAVGQPIKSSYQVANDARAIGPAGENLMINRSRFVPPQDPQR